MFLDNFVKYSILKKEIKRGAVWLWGSSNTGKSSLLKLIEKIFTVVKFVQTRSRFDLPNRD